MHLFFGVLLAQDQVDIKPPLQACDSLPVSNTKILVVLEGCRP